MYFRTISERCSTDSNKSDQSQDSVSKDTCPLHANSIYEEVPEQSQICHFQDDQSADDLCSVCK